MRKSQENGFEIAYDQEVTGIRRISAEEITDRRAHSSNFDPACDANDHDPSSESSHPHSDTSTSGCWEITTNKTTFRAKTIILASGGCSYPGTGSDGQLFSVLQRDLDLEMTPLQPAPDIDPRPELSLREAVGDLLQRLPDQSAAGTKKDR